MIFSKETATFFEIYKQLEVENQEYINNSLPNLTLQEIDVNFKLQSGEKVFSNTPVTIYLQHHTKNLLCNYIQNIRFPLKMELVLWLCRKEN